MTDMSQVDPQALEDDVPTLNAVVQSGDETIIQTTRLGREVIRELNAISNNQSPHIHVGIGNDELHVMIDEVVRRHMTEMRQELKDLLDSALSD